MDPLISAGVALITGSASGQSFCPDRKFSSRLTNPGIGQRLAVTFAERGCNKIFLVDISQQGLEKTQELIAQVDDSAKVIKHTADLTDDAAVKNMVDTCIREFGRVDFACNNAGIGMPNMLTADTPTKLFDKVFDVNLKTVSAT
jgi:NAD(P)-dependent dehydrogenase (short-subunit alcohol dehydrogenase family)